MVTEAFAPGFDRIVSPSATIELVAGGFIFTEGPVWNGSEGFLAWVDIIGDAIYKWVPGEQTRCIMSPSSKANGMTYDYEGRLLVAGWSSRSVWRWEHDGSTTTLASHYQGKRLDTPNDIVVRTGGDIYFTDMAGGLNLPGHQVGDVQKYLDFQGVYRVNPNDRTLTLLVEDMEAPNGLCFSPDESLLYVNDTARRHIRVWDVRSDGTLANGRLFAELIGDDPGIPDGMKVDREGNVYCTGPGGLWVIDPQGKALGRVLVPEQCANFAWGDQELTTLYMTARSSVYRLTFNIPGISVWPKP